MRRLLALAVLLLAGCTDPHPEDAVGTGSPPPSSPSASGSAVAGATLPCGDAIDGGPPPADFTVVLGAVALPTSPGYPALQAAANGPAGGPRLFAKTGLLVRAGVASTLTVADVPGNRIGIAWGNPGPAPSRIFAVPACPDNAGTRWLAYAGGYYVDQPLCLPLTVHARGREQQVRIGIGTPCPGQAPPAGTG